MIQDYEIHLTSSIGIPMSSVNGSDSTKLIHSADKALYFAKEKRDHFEFYS